MQRKEEREANPASAKDQAEGSRENVNVGPDNEAEGELSGKTDSGPEPDVFGREIPPQD